MINAVNAPGMTKWTNPVGKPTVKLHLYLHPPVIIPHPAGPGFPGTLRDTGFLDVEIPPGEACLLPSKFDQAIQKLDEKGVVQSGECPWLIKNDGGPPEVHPSLDPVEQQRLQAELDAERARAKAAEAEAEQFRAKQLLQDAERQQREADEKAKADQAARDQLAKDLAEVAQAKADLAKMKAELEEQKAAMAKAAVEQAKPAVAEGSSDAAGSSSSKPKGK